MEEVRGGIAFGERRLRFGVSEELGIVEGPAWERFRCNIRKQDMVIFKQDVGCKIRLQMKRVAPLVSGYFRAHFRTMQVKANEGKGGLRVVLRNPQLLILEETRSRVSSAREYATKRGLCPRIVCSLFVSLCRLRRSVAHLFVLRTWR